LIALLSQYGPFIMVHIGDHMTRTTKPEAAIGVTAFKSQCLGLIDDVAQGKTGRIVLLKHNRPIAAIVPLPEAGNDIFELWGAMRGTVKVAPGVDLTEPTGETWDAER
jgi:antitoxin (DNA-binding transcriptional repressor) of toxin-antitoxin stability system